MVFHEIINLAEHCMSTVVMLFRMPAYLPAGQNQLF